MVFVTTFIHGKEAHDASFYWRTISATAELSAAAIPARRRSADERCAFRRHRHASIGKEDLAALYRARWHNELDLRTIKSTMQMHDLRCKTPEQVHKEVWTHALAYNLIRTIMAQAAQQHQLEPRSISFKATVQTLAAFQPLIAYRAAQYTADRWRLYQQLLATIATQRVADRPDRYEPRLIKHRRDHYGRLTKPRAETKRQMAKRLTVI